MEVGVRYLATCSDIGNSASVAGATDKGLRKLVSNPLTALGSIADDATASITLGWPGTTRTNSYGLYGANRSVRMRNGRLDLTTRTRARSWATEDH